MSDALIAPLARYLKEKLAAPDLEVASIARIAVAPSFPSHRFRMPAVGSSIASNSGEYFCSGAGVTLISAPAASASPSGRSIQSIATPCWSRWVAGA